MSFKIIGTEILLPSDSLDQMFGGRLIIQDLETGRYYDNAENPREIWDTELESAVKDKRAALLEHHVPYVKEKMSDWMVLMLSPKQWEIFDYDHLNFFYTVYEKLIELDRLFVTFLYMGDQRHRDASNYQALIASKVDLEFIDYPKYLKYDVPRRLHIVHKYPEHPFFKQADNTFYNEALERRRAFENYIRPV